MLKCDSEFKAHYIIYQALFRAMTKRDFNTLESALERRRTPLSIKLYENKLKDTTKASALYPKQFHLPI